MRSFTSYLKDSGTISSSPRITALNHQFSLQNKTASSIRAETRPHRRGAQGTGSQRNELVFANKLRFKAWGKTTSVQARMLATPMLFIFRKIRRSFFLPGKVRTYVAYSFFDRKCHCGKKSTMNMRMGSDGKAIKEGAQVEIGGNERSVALCRNQWRDAMA
jgi:hypothetical protein